MRLKLLISLVFIVSLSLTEFKAHALDQVNRYLTFADTNQLSYERNIVFKEQNNSLSPCLTSELKDKCNPASNSLVIYNVLGPCFEKSTNPCIENVWRSDLRGNWIKGEYKGLRIPLSKTDSIWDKDYLPGIDFPRNSSLYEFPGLPHAKGTLFEIDPIIKGRSKFGSQIDYSELRLQTRAIYQTSNFNPLIRKECMDFLTSTEDRTKEPCWVASDSDSDWNIKVSLQLPTAPFGWVTGRLIDSSMSVSTSSNPNLPVIFTISGRPALTPSLTRDFRRDNPTDYEDWNKIANVFNLPWDNISKGPVLGPNSLSQFLQVTKLLPSLDKSTSEHVAWNVDLIWDKGSPQNKQFQTCGTNEIIGYVGSNSLTFLDTVPIFDPKTSTIRYTVASPHFDSLGAPSTGQYQLQINLDVAKCLWKISSVPLKAEINVTNSYGEKKLVTSSMKVSGNFLNFSVSGYGYSESTISIGIPVVEASPLPNPSTIEPKSTDSKNKSEATPSTSKSAILTKDNALIQKTITCIKGKLTKKVTGVKPACPSGYKQK